MRILLRSLMTGATLALYLTAAFAIVPALGSDNSNPTDAASVAVNGVLVAIGLVVVTLGTAVARWFRDELPGT